MREEEFAPVKNANGASYDTPDSAKLMLLRLHSRWVVAAGGFLTHSVPLYMTGKFSPVQYIQKLAKNKKQGKMIFSFTNIVMIDFACRCGSFST